jgi:rhodanese-related sulfurtransferase
MFSVSGCSSTKVDAATATAIIDVRTPADKAGTYFLYCHSGRRAGIATDQMKSMGFANVTNLGGMEDAAAATSLPIVR